MCIICYKPKNVNLPKTLQTCWNNNPDGCGYCFPENGKVIIKKGFMTFSDFEKSLQEFQKTHDLKKTPMLFHFRITTHGGTCKEYTHPFPVSDNLNTLTAKKSKSDFAICHNGIIDNFGNKKISDTAQYVQKVVSPLFEIAGGNITDNLCNIIENTISGSRFAIMSKAGKVNLIGNWYEYDGSWYSNLNYTPKTYFYDYSYEDTVTYGRVLYDITDIDGLTVDGFPINYWKLENEQAFVDYSNDLYILGEDGLYYSYSEKVKGLPASKLGLRSVYVKGGDIYEI